MAAVMRIAVIVAVAWAFTPLAMAKQCCQHEEMAGKCSSCSSAKAGCGHGSCSHHKAGCCGKHACCQATQWADPANVHWVHKGVSFGNYMKLAKAEIPAAAAAIPAPAFGPIYFDFDKSFLRPESKEVCHQVVAYLKANPGATITIEGNCCDIGTEQYNKALGKRRAASVKKFLVENGIDGKRVKGVSLGESKPKHPESERHLNRRDDFIIRVN